MHSTILRAAALILFSSAVMVQPTDTKSPRSEFTDGQDARLRAFCSRSLANTLYDWMLAVP